MERVGVGLGKARASLASGPENSPRRWLFCNLQAGKEEDSQASKSPPPSPVSFTQFINVK